MCCCQCQGNAWSLLVFSSCNWRSTPTCILEIVKFFHFIEACTLFDKYFDWFYFRILNKLTPEKFDKLSLELLNVGIETNTILHGVILLVSISQIEQTHSCHSHFISPLVFLNKERVRFFFPTKLLKLF